MNDKQIKYMVARFLGWKLPADFKPDAGISFKADYNENTEYPAKHQPVGTNLFDATQTEAMVRYLAQGIDLVDERPTSDTKSSKSAPDSTNIRAAIDKILRHNYQAILDSNPPKNVSFMLSHHTAEQEIEALLASAVEAYKQMPNPSHEYLRTKIINTALATSTGFFGDSNIIESEDFYEYCEAVADKILAMLETEGVTKREVA